MTVCPYCGKESNQPDAAYCLYCGSSLRQQQTFAAPSQGPAAVQGFGTPVSTRSPELSERYERTLARVEQLGTIVAVLAVVTLVLVLL